MNNTTSAYHYRRRIIGRAASPPTWACYEQIPYNEDGCSESGSDSCSEDEEDYGRDGMDDQSNDSDAEPSSPMKPSDDGGHDIDTMDLDEEGDEVAKKLAGNQKDSKGKQRAMDSERSPIRRHRQKKQRQQVITLRPILTIQRSQGFVWNQDLFIPPYIKDRYVASTSPPHASGFISTSASSTNSALNEYEVEVVEIRVREGELDDIIP